MNKESLYKQMKIDEGVKYEIYLDHLGYKTFGVGHLITEIDEEYNLPIGTEISEKRVKEVFDRDISNAIEDCIILYGDGSYDKFNQLPSEVQEILINMMFNLGRTRLRMFRRFNAAIKAGDWKEAAAEGRDSRWYEQVTNRAERLMKRLENI